MKNPPQGVPMDLHSATLTGYRAETSFLGRVNVTLAFDLGDRWISLMTKMEPEMAEALGKLLVSSGETFKKRAR